MCGAEQVRAAVKTLTELTDEELDAYGFIIENAAASAESGDGPKTVMLAAAKAAYDIALSRAQNAVTSFKAGDVSFQLSQDALTRARRVYENALAESANDAAGGFVFRSV